MVGFDLNVNTKQSVKRRRREKIERRKETKLYKPFLNF